MSDDFDVLGGNPEGKPREHGLILKQVCKSSFEFETLARSYAATDAAREELGREFEIEFIEDDAPAMSAAPEPIDEAQRTLDENADAILSALATLWALRVAIARATGNEKDYRAACAAEGIKP